MSTQHILTDETLFDTCAALAANHILKQDDSIRLPIAQYGAVLHNNVPVGREVLAEFYRALCRAQVHNWTAALDGYDNRHHLTRMENQIAQNVYLALKAKV